MSSMATPSNQDQIAQIRGLLSILNSSAETLIAALKSCPTDPLAARVPKTPETAEAQRRILASTAALEAALLTPQWRIGEIAHSYFLPRCLHIAVELGIPKLLLKHGAMRAGDIANKVGIEEKRLCLILRTLCTNHVFEEVEPGVFANDETSRALADEEVLEGSVKFRFASSLRSHSQ
jgi:hypothetical protein